eukprot:gnl/TRDRNA2_/TRDRNA2_169766_c2_seq1.p1 gnl/TRDRNA2_/TRDRNA2_169766_c2~~gnl/TRDRNA2_/TRDRNA2_169766_c2_seq1.p1  ORF type:complete len:739 (+),score=80.58 gnl/TRDRNA2_/TRDRNA2_169766_c2_seq1:162-2378(+)
MEDMPNGTWPPIEVGTPVSRKASLFRLSQTDSQWFAGGKRAKEQNLWVSKKLATHPRRRHLSSPIFRPVSAVDAERSRAGPTAHQLSMSPVNVREDSTVSQGTTPSRKSVAASWQWESDDVWHSFSPRAGEHIEEAYRAGKDSCFIVLENVSTEVSINLMKMVPSGKQIRRWDGTHEPTSPVTPLPLSAQSASDQQTTGDQQPTQSPSRLLQRTPPPRASKCWDDQTMTPSPPRLLQKAKTHATADITPPKADSRTRIKRALSASATCMNLQHKARDTAAAMRRELLLAADRELPARLSRKLSHPALAEMPDPQFQYGEDASTTMSSDLAIFHRSDADPMQGIWSLAQVYARKLKKRPVLLPATEQPRQMMASLSLALHLVGGATSNKLTFLLGRLTPFARSLSYMILEAWKEWSLGAMTMLRTMTLEKLTALDVPPGGYRWVCQNVDPRCRIERTAAACATLWHAPSMAGARELVFRTELLSWQHCPTPFPAQRDHQVVVSLSNLGPLETALLETRKDRHVAVAIPCCSNQVGGGFLAGDTPHGAEEALCVQSTLFLSLREAARQAEVRELRSFTGKPVHIPEDGIVLSPRVKVFRHGPERGYSPLPSPVELGAVLCVGMPSLDRGSRGSPAASPRSNTSLSELDLEMLERKFAMILHGANSMRAEVLVMADVSGDSGRIGQTFHNQAIVMGQVFGRALSRYRGELLQVVLTGSADFQRAVRKPLDPKEFNWRSHCS